MSFFYSYDQRMNQLSTINQMQDQQARIRALEDFIDQERRLIAPSARSQALDSANRTLARLLSPPIEVNPNVVRRLFTSN